jgi:hypothetical protein
MTIIYNNTSIRYKFVAQAGVGSLDNTMILF